MESRSRMPNHFTVKAALVVSASLFVLWAAPRAAHAAGETTGRIAGSVTEAQTGAPVPGATVTVSGPALIGGPRTYTTADDGRYLAVELPPGRYDVEVSYSGVKPIRRRIVVRQGETAPLDIAWSAELAQTEVTVVVEERHLTKPDSTQSGTVISADTQAKIASARRYQFLAGQVAGVSNDITGGLNPNIKGGNLLANRSLVDGLDITDPTTNTFSANMNFDSVASVEVITGGMEAQYNSLGGVINLISTSGSDEWHVDASFYVNNSAFTATNKYGPSLYSGYRQFDRGPKPPTESYQANLNVGGPIVKHRLWFNTSVEYLYESQAQPKGPPINVQHPSYYRHQVLARIKLTWAPNERHRLTLTASSETGFLNNIGTRYYGLANYTLGAAELHQDQGGVFTTLQWDYFHSQNANLTVQGGFQWSYINFGPQGYFGSIEAPPAGSKFSDKNFHYDRNQASHDNLSDGTTWYNQGGNGFDYSEENKYTYALDPSLSLRGHLAGYHDSKMGIQSRFVQHKWYQHRPGGSKFVDSGETGGLESGLCNEQMPGANCFQRIDMPDWRAHRWGFGVGFFVQDRWKPFKRLTVLPGIRFDWGITKNTLGQTVSNLFGVGPRIGFTFDLTGDQKTIFSAFYGRANETMSLMPATYADLTGLETTYQFNPTTKTFEKYQESGGANGYQIDPNAKTPHSDEFTTSLRREIFRDSVAGIEYTYKKYSNLWDNVEVNQIWDPTGTRLIGYVNGEPRRIYKITTPDQNYRIYQGVDFTVESRPTPNWELYAAYTLSWLYGPGAEQFGQVVGLTNSAFYNPRFTYLFEGYLPEDRRHQLKVRASYSYKGLTMGGFFSYQSGTPTTKLYYNQNDGFAGGYTTHRTPQGTEPGGENNNPQSVAEFRLPERVSVDARVTYDFHGLIRQHLILIADFFNVFNLTPATAIENTDIPTYGQVTSRSQLPFRFQLGLRYIY